MRSRLQLQPKRGPRLLRAQRGRRLSERFERRRLELRLTMLLARPPRNASLRDFRLIPSSHDSLPKLRQLRQPLPPPLAVFMLKPPAAVIRSKTAPEPPRHSSRR